MRAFCFRALARAVDCDERAARDSRMVSPFGKYHEAAAGRSQASSARLGQVSSMTVVYPGRRFTA